MLIGNTVTVDRRVVVDAETGAEEVTCLVRLHYFDGDSERDVVGELDAVTGSSVFGAVAKVADAHLAGRAEALSAVAAEAEALAKPVQEVR